MSKPKKVSHDAIASAKVKQCQELQMEAQTAGESIQFYLDSTGAKESLGLDYSSNSLLELERVFRVLMGKKEKLPEDLPFDMFVRLTGIYLGEVITRERLGKWVEYDGPYHTLNRIVVQIDDALCDPLLFVSLLPRAKIARGMKEGKALYYFAKSAVQLGVMYQKD